MTEALQRQLELRNMTNAQAPDSAGRYGNPTEKGVTISWLAQAFKMTEKRVRERLKNCPPKKVSARGTKMLTTTYDLAEAARYLVEPLLDTEDYMAALRRGELPPQLQQSVWDALLKRQKWEENAGDLWRTAQVRDVLGGVFQNLKFTLSLWPDTIERQLGVTEAQRKLLIEMSDQLQAELYDSLVTEMKSRTTGSQLSELAKLVGGEEAEPQPARRERAIESLV